MAMLNHPDADGPLQMYRCPPSDTCGGPELGFVCGHEILRLETLHEKNLQLLPFARWEGCELCISQRGTPQMSSSGVGRSLARSSDKT